MIDLNEGGGHADEFEEGRWQSVELNPACRLLFVFFFRVLFLMEI